MPLLLSSEDNARKLCIRSTEQNTTNKIFRRQCAVPEPFLVQSMLLLRFASHEESFLLLCLVYQERGTVLATEFQSDKELICRTRES